MEKSKNIILEFMKNNPDDIFKLLLPLKLKLDFDNYANNKFEVIVQNCTKRELFIYDISPELLFTHFPVEKPFLNGKKTNYYTNQHIQKLSFDIDTAILGESDIFPLHDLLEEKDIVFSLIGYKRTYLALAKHIKCFYIEHPEYNLIIPHYTVAVYYYFRFTHLREAAFNNSLEDLYQVVTCENDEALIVLKQKRTDADAAFIHRFAYQEDAKNAFEDVGRYINSYLRYMKDHTPDKEITDIPIKVKFPIKDQFRIDVRATEFKGEQYEKPTYFIHEIINDFSNIGFKKLTKLLQKNKLITTTDDLSSLPVIQSETPENTTEILKEVAAKGTYTHNQIQKDKHTICGSLKNIEVEEEEVTLDVITQILQINEEVPTDTPIDQSTTESTKTGIKTVRKVVVSTKLKEELEKEGLPKEHIENFEVFNQYTDFLQTQSMIKNFRKNSPQKLPQIIDEKTQKVKSKCKLYKREKEYITATFEYKNLYVGLLDSENGTKLSVSTWVIISNEPIGQNTFDLFIGLYFKDDMSIEDIKKLYKTAPLKFTTKNHEHVKELSHEDLLRWSSGLLGKVIV